MKGRMGGKLQTVHLFIFSLLLFWLHEYFAYSNINCLSIFQCTEYILILKYWLQLLLPLLLVVVVVILVTSLKYLLSEAFFVLTLQRSLL